MQVIAYVNIGKSFVGHVGKVLILPSRFPVVPGIIWFVYMGIDYNYVLLAVGDTALLVLFRYIILYMVSWIQVICYDRYSGYLFSLQY